MSSNGTVTIQSSFSSDRSYTIGPLTNTKTLTQISQFNIGQTGNTNNVLRFSDINNHYLTFIFEGLTISSNKSHINGVLFEAGNNTGGIAIYIYQKKIYYKLGGGSSNHIQTDTNETKIDYTNYYGQKINFYFQLYYSSGNNSIIKQVITDTNDNILEYEEKTDSYSLGDQLLSKVLNEPARVGIGRSNNTNISAVNVVSGTNITVGNNNNLLGYFNGFTLDKFKLYQNDSHNIKLKKYLFFL